MFTIYALIDPRDHLIHYVGMTDDVYARFLQHIRCDGSNPGKDAWIHELRQANEMVIMQTLQAMSDLDQAKCFQVMSAEL